MQIETNVLRNNELITGISILAVLRYMKQIDIAKCMLIEPLLSYSKVVQSLGRSNCSVKSIEDLIIKESVVFANFNERYAESSILSFNALMLFEKMGLLSVCDGMIYYQADQFDFENKTLGNKVRNRIGAAKRVADILAKGEAGEFYLSLRVEL